MNTNSVTFDLKPSKLILTKLDAKSINNFLKEAGEYIKNNKSTSLTKLVDKNILEALMNSECFPEAKSVKDIKDKNLCEILEGKASKGAMCVTQKAIALKMHKKVEINMDEKNVELRILSLFTDYQRFMMNAGMENFIHEKPKLAGRHIYMLLKPQQLKEEIQKIVEDDDFAQDKDFQWYTFYRQVRNIGFQQDVEFFFTEEVIFKDSAQLVEKYNELCQLGLP